MADILSREQRLLQTNTRLKNNNERLRKENTLLRREVRTLKKELEVLNLKYENKELQRRLLLQKLYKPNKAARDTPLGKKPGAPAYHRPTPKDQDVTETVTFTPVQCPYCHLSDGLDPAQDTIIKYQEDIVIVPRKVVKKYVITKHWCSHCKEYIRSDHVPPSLERIGPNVMAYVLYARYRLRLPYNKIHQSLTDLYGFHLSEGEIAAQLKQAHTLFGKDYEAITALIRIAEAVYCDETGWRVKGKNFWIWVFVTKQGIRYVIEDTRGKGVPENALGDKHDRVLISDFYAAYKNLPGENQYCWVHLMRDSTATESKLHDDILDVYRQLKVELAKNLPQRNRKRLDKLLEDIGQKQYLDGDTLAVTKLQKRIMKTRSQLLTCLAYKDVLPENNTAERALRNNVVMRKIFGGSRSLEGAKVMEVNTSVLDTLQIQHPNQNFFQTVLPRLKELRGE